MNVQTFDFKGAGVRTVEIDGEIHFVAKDVCDALGYFEVQSTLDKLDEDEHLISKITSSGQARDMKLVTESGLYTLIIRSPKKNPARHNGRTGYYQLITTIQFNQTASHHTCLGALYSGYR